MTARSVLSASDSPVEDVRQMLYAIFCQLTPYQTPSYSESGYDIAFAV